jgi:hypothetical protein
MKIPNGLKMNRSLGLIWSCLCASLTKSLTKPTTMMAMMSWYSLHGLLQACIAFVLALKATRFESTSFGF